MNSYKWKRNLACVKYHEVELERRNMLQDEANANTMI